MDSARLTPLPGVSGTLFPSRFLASMSLEANPACAGGNESVERRRRYFLAWWTTVERHCGPATGLRALFDRVAMPLASLLNFRAHDAEFEDRLATARLESVSGLVQLVLAPWATRPSRVWRGLKQADAATWCLLVAPPFVTYTTPGTKNDTKQVYRRAINAALERCAPLPFSKSFSGAIAGQPISVRYVDDRSMKTSSPADR